MLAVFDVGGPLAAYYALRAAGLSPVGALILSGVLPAAGLIITFSLRRRADAVGVLVLAGIVAGSVLGLAVHSAKPVLGEGSVGTAVFGLMCLGSLRLPKPLMYRLALEFTGPETATGREMAGLWQYPGFRRVFRVITAVWGAGFLAEAAARVLIVQETPAGTALAVSRVMPYAVAAVLIAWTIGYGQYRKRKGGGQPAAPAEDPAASQEAQAPEPRSLAVGDLP